MKRIFAWFFIFIFLSGTTEAHEFLKLPMLFDHYTEHSSQRPELSFLDFLNEHYLGNAAHSHSHDQLPFQGNHHNHVLEIPIDQPVPNQLCLMVLLVHPEHSTPVLSFIPEGCSVSVWQPPKF
jgi:hypothetical protein